MKKKNKNPAASKDVIIQVHHGNSSLHTWEFTYFMKPGSFTNCSKAQCLQLFKYYRADKCKKCKPQACKATI